MCLLKKKMNGVSLYFELIFLIERNFLYASFPLFSRNYYFNFFLFIYNYFLFKKICLLREAWKIKKRFMFFNIFFHGILTNFFFIDKLFIWENNKF